MPRFAEAAPRWPTAWYCRTWTSLVRRQTWSVRDYRSFRAGFGESEIEACRLQRLRTIESMPEMPAHRLILPPRSLIFPLNEATHLPAEKRFFLNRRHERASADVLFRVPGRPRYAYVSAIPSGHQRVTGEAWESLRLRSPANTAPGGILARMPGQRYLLTHRSSSFCRSRQPQRVPPAISPPPAIIPPRHAALDDCGRWLAYAPPTIMFLHPCWACFRLDAMVEWFFTRRRPPGPLPAARARAPRPGPATSCLTRADHLVAEDIRGRCCSGFMPAPACASVQMIPRSLRHRAVECFQPGFARLLFTGEFDKASRPHVRSLAHHSRLPSPGKQLMHYSSGRSLPRARPIACPSHGWIAFRSFGC